MKGIDAICMFSDCENILALVQGFIQASVGLVLLNNCFRREGDQIQETSLILHGLSETKVTWMLI